MSLTKLSLAALSGAIITIGTGVTALAHDHGDKQYNKVEQAKAEHSTMEHGKEQDHSNMGHDKMMGHGKMMDHSKMDHDTMMDHSKMDHSKMDHSKMDHSKMDHSTMDHSTMEHGKEQDHSKMGHDKMMGHSSTQNVAAKSAIKLHMAWSSALPPVATNGAAYLMVHNYSNDDDKIIGASTPIAKQVMFHASKTKNGTTTMIHQTSIDLKAGGAVTFKPGTRHLMLMGLKKPLVAGNSFPLTLMLEKAGPVTVMVKVKSLN